MLVTPRCVRDRLQSSFSRAASAVAQLRQYHAAVEEAPFTAASRSVVYNAVYNPCSMPCFSILASQKPHVRITGVAEKTRNDTTTRVQ